MLFVCCSSVTEPTRCSTLVLPHSPHQSQVQGSETPHFGRRLLTLALFLASPAFLIETRGTRVSTVRETPLDQPFAGYTWAGPPAPLPAFMPAVEGKFISTGGGKWFVRGVTCGTFGTDSEGMDYPAESLVERDFAAMWDNGFNTVRTYTVPHRCTQSARYQDDSLPTR